MAKDNADNVTTEMFHESEKEILSNAMDAYIASLKRRANNEKNAAVKTIREIEVKMAAQTLNKLQGLA